MLKMRSFWAFRPKNSSETLVTFHVEHLFPKEYYRVNDFPFSGTCPISCDILKNSTEYCMAVFSYNEKAGTYDKTASIH